MKSLTVVDAPIDYDVSEMFFSTTDDRGVIKAGNDLFVRISEFTREEILGEPHNCIRHPDMPRAVFRLFWTFLKSGKPVVAYVKNRAKSGRYYWVIAYVQPVAGGFLSIRIKPTSELFQKISSVYATVLEAEKHGGMDAAANKLMDVLKSLGFDSYEDFMTHALNEELKSADRIIAARGPLSPAGSAAVDSAGHRERSHNDSLIADSQEVFEDVGDLNQDVFSKMDSFTRVGPLLNERLHTIQNMKMDLRHISINTAIQSDKLGHKGAALTVVAGLVQNISNETSTQVGLIQEIASALLRNTGEVSLNIGAAKIQIEMSRRFIADLLKESSAESTDHSRFAESMENCDGLLKALKQCIQTVTNSLEEFSINLMRMSSLIQQLEEIILTLEVARKSGLIESKRIGSDGEVFSSFLDSMDKIVRTERQKLMEMSSALQGVSRTAKECQETGLKMIARLVRVNYAAPVSVAS